MIAKEQVRSGKECSLALDMQLIGNIVVYAMWAWFYPRTLRPKYAVWLCAAGTFLSTCAGGLICHFWLRQVPALRFFFGIGILVGVAWLLFEGSWTKKLFVAGTAFLAVNLAEIVIYVFVPEIANMPDWISIAPVWEQARVIIATLSVTALLLWLLSLPFVRQAERLGAREWLLYVLFPISQGMCLMLWRLSARGTGETGKTVWLLLTAVMCILADTALYFAVRGMAQRAELKAKSDLLAQQLVIQKQHYADLTAQYESIRHLRHDIANHIHTVQTLLEEGRTEEASQYTELLRSHDALRPVPAVSGNPIADAFLAHRTALLEADGIRVETGIRLDADGGIADADLVTVLGNLLDNAGEACMALPEADRYIRLLIDKKGVWLVIHMENSAPAASAEKTPRIEGLHRGIGMHILERMAAQYGGTLSGEQAGGVFKVTMIMNTERKPI